MAVQIQTEKKGGGGGLLGAIGSALGTIVGVAAAPFTAGASLLPTIGTAIGGAAAGAGLGGTLGGLADKVTDKGGGGPGIGTALSRRAQALESPASVTSGDSNKVLEDALTALPQAPAELQKQAGPILAGAYDMTRRRQPKGSGGVVS